jgi:predicted porin
MKKTLIATAVAAGVLATGAAQATPTVYGILHLSIDTFADEHLDPTATTINDAVIKSDSPTMNSNTSAVGIKGTEDLGGGLKAIYKAEFKVDPFNSARSLERRDVWLGLKGGWGKVAVGTMSSNYKQMGGKIDPLYRTVAEARGILNMQSDAHSGSGINGGRMERTLQYTTPKMAGIEIVLNTTLFGQDVNGCSEALAPTGFTADGESCDETIGAGIRWSNKNWLLYADYLDPNQGGEGAFGATGRTQQYTDDSIAKIGGKWSNKSFQVGAQYEMAEDLTGGDYMFLNGLWNINKKNTITASYGQQDKISSAYNLAYVFKMSKQTNVYAGYGMVEADTCNKTTTATATLDPNECSYELGVDKNGVVQDTGSVLTLGIRKSF